MNSDQLAHDGWQHHRAYHWLIEQATRGRFVMVMPDVTVDHGAGPEVAVYRMPYNRMLRSLVSPYAKVRALGFVGFACGAHGVAEAANVNGRTRGTTEERL